MRLNASRAMCLAVVVFTTACGDVPSSPTTPTVTPIPSRLTATATPSVVLLSGGTVSVMARLIASDGSPISNSPISFSASAGSLSSDSAMTDAMGNATVQLVTSEQASVTATGQGMTATVLVPAVAPFTLRLDANTPAFVDDTTIVVTVTPTIDVPSPPRPSEVTVQCGVGASWIPTSTVGAGSFNVRCVFATTGPQTVTARGRTTGGWTTSQDVTVQAISRPVTPVPPTPTPTPPPVRLTIVPNIVRTTTTTQLVTFTANLNQSIDIVTYEWDFGDGGAKVTTSSPLANNTYTQEGGYVVLLKATSTDGTVYTATAFFVARFTDPDLPDASEC